MVGNSSAKGEVKGYRVKLGIIFASLLLAQVIAGGVGAVFALTSITGTVYYNGTESGTVFVDAFDIYTYSDYATSIASPGVYNITVPDGTYIVHAYMDVNGNGSYDAGEPLGFAINESTWENATQINVSGTSVAGVDITLSACQNVTFIKVLEPSQEYYKKGIIPVKVVSLNCSQPLDVSAYVVYPDGSYEKLNLTDEGSGVKSGEIIASQAGTYRLEFYNSAGDMVYRVFSVPISGNAEISWNASYPYVYYYNVYDINCDGKNEVVVHTTNKTIAVFDSSGNFIWNVSFGYAPEAGLSACPYRVEVGGDYYNWNITVLNSSDGSKIWEKQFNHKYYSFGNHRALDLNGDGKKDVLVTVFRDGSEPYNYTIYAIDLASGSELWNYFILNAFELQLLSTKKKLDLNNDGAEDVVISYWDEKNYNDVTVALSGSDGSVIWQANNVYIRSITDNVDGDGVMDLLAYTAMVSGKNGSTIYTFDYAASDAVDDATGDGISDFATFCKVSQICYDGIFRFRSGVDGSVVWSLNLSGAEYASLELSDNKSKTGIVRAYNSTQGTKLLKVNLSDGSILWEKQINGTRCKATAAGDLNGDGSYDVLCYDSYRDDIMVYYPYYSSSYLAAVDGASGTTLWEFINKTIPFIGDFNGDGKGDIVLGMQSYYDYMDNFTVVSGDNTSEVIFSFDPAGNLTVGLRDKYLTTSPTLSNDERGIDLTGDGKADLPVLVNPGENNSEILLLTYSTPDTTPSSITFSSPTPANDSVLNDTSAIINITSDEPLADATFKVQRWQEGEWGWFYNDTFVAGAVESYPMNKATDHIWWYNVTASNDIYIRYRVEARDLAGNSNTTDTRYLKIAGFAPLIYAKAPFYVPQYSTVLNKLYLFINEGSPDKLKVYRNGSLIKTLSYPGFESFNVSIDASQVGVWNYTLVVNDTFGNVNSTSLLVTVTPAEASVEKKINGSPIHINETLTNTSVALELLPEANAGVLSLNASMSINVSEIAENTSNDEFLYTLGSEKLSLDKFVKIEVGGDVNAGALHYAVIKVQYALEDLDKNGDGNADVNESTLTLWRYCSADDAWLEIPHGSNYNISCGDENITVFGSGVDTSERIVWANLSHLSIFGIAGAVTDTDGDGIPDINDSCPTQAENFNGYRDDDGCPDTKPSAPSGGGGGGDLPENAVEIPKIKAGESHVTVFNDKYVPDIPSIEIFASQDQYYTRISVDTYREKPGWVIFDDAPGKVYRYFKIRYSKPNTYVEKAKITFRVNESWLKAEDIDPSTVMMYRLNEAKQWEKLSTTPEKAKEGYIYYVAETSGFSWFAVTGKKGSGFRDIFAKAEEVKPTPTPAPKPVQEEKPVVTTPPETKLPVATPKPKPEVKPTPAPKPEVEKPEKRGICGPTLVSALAMLAMLLRRRK